MTQQVFWYSAESSGFAKSIVSPGDFPGLSSFHAGDDILIGGSEAHHATVKRLRTGEIVDVVDGLGWRADAEVASATNAELSLRLVSDPEEDPQPKVRITLIQALAKEKRDMQALESATEMGVSRVIPWGAARSVSRWDTVPKRAKGREKWRNLVISAMKQSRQARLTEVGEYLESGGEGLPGRTALPGGGYPLEESGKGTGLDSYQKQVSNGTVPLVGSKMAQDTDHLGSSTSRPAERTVFSEVSHLVDSGATVFVLHEVTTEYLTEHLETLVSRGEEPAEIVIIVGPEGGITNPELRAFMDAGATPVLLGPTVLRCSSAGPAAVAVIQASCGSWRKEASHE